MPPRNAVGTVDDDQKLHFHRESEAGAVTINTPFSIRVQTEPQLRRIASFSGREFKELPVCPYTEIARAEIFGDREIIVFWRMTMSCCARVCGVYWKMNRTSKW